MVFNCRKVSINNSNKNDCSNGDKLTVTTRRKSRVYCKKQQVYLVSEKSILVVFSSDARRHSIGAMCKVTCKEGTSYLYLSAHTILRLPTFKKVVCKQNAPEPLLWMDVVAEVMYKGQIKLMAC